MWAPAFNGSLYHSIDGQDSRVAACGLEPKRYSHASKSYWHWEYALPRPPVARDIYTPNPCKRCLTKESL